MAGRPPRPRRRARGPAEDATACRRAELARRLLDRLRPHAEELGSADELEAIEDILENGNGASRQVVVYEANHDLREVVGEIVEASVPEAAETAASSAPTLGRHGCGYPRWGVSQPDLFVVCKNCGSEVSPYVTECPYCGQRVRKRAPKIDRSGRRAAAQAAGAAAPKLPRLRAERDRGHRARTRGRTRRCALIAPVAAGRRWSWPRRGPDLDRRRDRSCPLDDEVWRWFATPFVHDSLGYQFVTLVAVGIFGTLLERRFGLVPVVAGVRARRGGRRGARGARWRCRRCSSNGLYAVLGANGAALGLLCAWLVDDRLAARRGDERDNDLIGVYVSAVRAGAAARSP